MKRYIQWSWMVTLLGLALLPLLNLTNPGLPVTHDGQDHVARIANFYQSLSEGIIVPRWAAKLNWGYGHPILMFLYPFPSYLATLFHFIGYSFVDSTKLVFAVGFVASFFAMYIWASTSWGRVAGVLAAVLYTFAPYRFIDLYVRGAIGEHVAFVFPPLICFGLLLLSRARLITASSLIYITLGTSLLILSHNALSLMFLPLCVLYMLYLALYEAKDRYKFIVIGLSSICWGFVLSAFFWVPALLEGKYTLRDIVTRGDVMERFVPLGAFFRQGWNYGGGNEFSKYLGTAQLIGVIVAMLQISKATKPQKVLLISMIVALVVSLLLMTSSASGVWQVVTLLQKFQFPWRILSVTVFLLSIIGALGAYMLPPSRRRWFVGGLCVISIISTTFMWQAKQYRVFPESYFTSVYHGTTDTGESSPIWSIRFMEHEPLGAVDVVSGEATVKKLVRSTNLHAYKVSVGSAEARLVENTLYFPGWQVYVNEKLADVQFQDPEFRGLMTFMVPKGEHIVRVEFGDTNLRKFASIISIVGAVVFVIFLGTMRLWKSKKRQSR